MKKIILAVFCVFCMMSAGFSQNVNLEELISPDYADYLKSNGNITIIHPKNNQYCLLSFLYNLKKLFPVPAPVKLLANFSHY